MKLLTLKRSMAFIIYLIIAAITFSAYGQESAPRGSSSSSSGDKCPVITVDCPINPAEPGKTMTFTANVKSDEPNFQPAFNWTVTYGTIISGQGTPTITVKIPEQTHGSYTITGTVEIAGIPSECTTNSASCTTNVCGLPPRKLDEYGSITRNEEKARLSNFAIALQNEPGAQSYIIAYGGYRSRAGEAQRRADFAKNYLINQYDIDARRIVTVDGGFKEETAVELWIVPQGAAPPTLMKVTP